MILDIDDCSPNPCEHGGMCTDGIDDYNCTCAAGFEGKNCAKSTVATTISSYYCASGSLFLLKVAKLC